jgi:hypothetical protein
MIPSFKQYLVEEEREIFFTFGRMNPPTIGHGKLLDTLASKAGKNPYKVFVSQSQNAKKDPLSYPVKIKHIRKMFPKHARSILLNKNVKTVFDAAVNLYDQGYKKITMVVGSDRVVEFQTLLNKYNGEKARHGFYNFETIRVISAGERDPDAEGVEGMSASKQRQNAAANDFPAFAQGLPTAMSNTDAKKLYNDVRIGMGLKEAKEFRTHIEFEPVSDIREKYIIGELFEPGDKVVIKNTNQEGVIHRLGANYVIVNLNEGNMSRQWLENVSKKIIKEVPTSVLIDKLKSNTVAKKKYLAALTVLKDIVARKKKEAQDAGTNMRHGVEYYAASIGRQYNVNPRVLASMLESNQPEWGTDASTEKAKKVTPGYKNTLNKVLNVRRKKK